MLIFANGTMKLRILEIKGDKVLFERLNDNTFVIADGVSFNQENNTCEWISGQYYEEKVGLYDLTVSIDKMEKSLESEEENIEDVFSSLYHNFSRKKR